MNSLTLSVTSALPQNQTRKRVTKKIIVWDFHKGGLELSAKKARKGLLREYYYFTFFLDPLPILVIYMFC